MEAGAGGLEPGVCLCHWTSREAIALILALPPQPFRHSGHCQCSWAVAVRNQAGGWPPTLLRWAGLPFPSTDSTWLRARLKVCLASIVKQLSPTLYHIVLTTEGKTEG